MENPFVVEHEMLFEKGFSKERPEKFRVEAGSGHRLVDGLEGSVFSRHKDLLDHAPAFSFRIGRPAAVTEGG
jgi:hypothetical protein